MKKFKTKLGHVVFELTRQEMKLIGSPGVCDTCLEKPQVGYLVVVLNRWLCPKCYKEWKTTAKYYPGDRKIEKINEQFYNRIYGRGEKQCKK